MEISKHHETRKSKRGTAVLVRRIDANMRRNQQRDAERAKQASAAACRLIAVRRRGITAVESTAVTGTTGLQSVRDCSGLLRIFWGSTST